MKTPSEVLKVLISFLAYLGGAISSHYTDIDSGHIPGGYELPGENGAKEEHFLLNA